MHDSTVHGVLFVVHTHIDVDVQLMYSKKLKATVHNRVLLYFHLT